MNETCFGSSTDLRFKGNLRVEWKQEDCPCKELSRAAVALNCVQFKSWQSRVRGLKNNATLKQADVEGHRMVTLLLKSESTPLESTPGPHSMEGSFASN